MPPFFMAATITVHTPPAAKATIPQDWQADQALKPLAEQPIVTLAAGLKTGTVGAAGTSDDPPVYTVTGKAGLIAPGGDATNGDLTKTGPAPAPTGGGTGGSTHP